MAKREARGRIVMLLKCRLVLLSVMLVLSSWLVAAETVKFEPAAVKSAADSVMTSTKYVRNVTSPNGFGESLMIEGNVFYAASGKVQADNGDELEYVLLIMGETRSLQGLIVTEHLPPFTEYVANSTRVNQQAVADIHASSAAFGALKVNAQPVGKSSQSSAVVSFRVKVKLLESEKKP